MAPVRALVLFDLDDTLIYPHPKEGLGRARPGLGKLLTWSFQQFEYVGIYSAATKKYVMQQLNGIRAFNAFKDRFVVVWTRQKTKDYLKSVRAVVNTQEWKAKGITTAAGNVVLVDDLDMQIRNNRRLSIRAPVHTNTGKDEGLEKIKSLLERWKQRRCSALP